MRNVYDYEREMSPEERTALTPEESTRLDGMRITAIENSFGGAGITPDLITLAMNDRARRVAANLGSEILDEYC